MTRAAPAKKVPSHPRIGLNEAGRPVLTGGPVVVRISLACTADSMFLEIFTFPVCVTGIIVRTACIHAMWIFTEQGTAWLPVRVKCGPSA